MAFPFFPLKPSPQGVNILHSKNDFANNTCVGLINMLDGYVCVHNAKFP